MNCCQYNSPYHCHKHFKSTLISTNSNNNWHGVAFCDLDSCTDHLIPLWIFLILAIILLVYIMKCQFYCRKILVLLYNHILMLLPLQNGTVRGILFLSLHERVLCLWYNCIHLNCLSAVSFLPIRALHFSTNNFFYASFLGRILRPVLRFYYHECVRGRGNSKAIFSFFTNKLLCFRCPCRKDDDDLLICYLLSRRAYREMHHGLWL